MANRKISNFHAGLVGWRLPIVCVPVGLRRNRKSPNSLEHTCVAGGVLDATRPQTVIYEPMPDGHLQLIGADFLVIASDWDKAHPGQGAPQLMGQLFHYFESPNRFGLPAFYTLHVWAWKENPNGAFVNWHPNVSCQAFAGQ